jgi:hypothetical protein
MWSDALKTTTDIPEVQLKSLTLDQWADHFKVDVPRLKSAMKLAMRKIFDWDEKVLKEKESDPDGVERRKGILRKQHRIGGKMSRRCSSIKCSISNEFTRYSRWEKI